jgi:predicted PurR-regulated permease PerM
MTTKRTATNDSTQTYSTRLRVLFWCIGIILFLVFLGLIKSILLPFVVGMLAAYFLDPAVRKLRSWKWSRSTSAAVITITFFTIAAAIFVLLVPLVSHQLSILIHDLPAYAQGMQSKYGKTVEGYLSQLSPDEVDTIRDTMAHFSGTFAQEGSAFATQLVQSGLAFLNIVLLIFITPVVVFYLLRDWDKVVKRFDDLLPRDQEKTIMSQLHEIDRILSGFIRGQTNVCLIMAAYYGVLLPLAQLKFGLVIGLLTGFMLFIPFVGFVTGCAFGMITALFQFDSSGHVIAVACIYLVGMVLENSVVVPRLVGDKVELHPLWVIFGMLAGGALFGFVGVLIAVPLTAVMGVLVRFAIDRYLHSSLYRGE